MRFTPNFQILNWWCVIQFSLGVTAVAIIQAMFLFWLLTAEGELTLWDLQRAFIIAAIIAPPIAFYFGRVMLRNTELAERLKVMVNRDRLTDVGTRDYFFARLAENPTAYGVSLMVDIDHFKSVNDTYGHFVGDEVIQKVAQVLKLHMRAQDVVCRFGGEEFVIFLEDAVPNDGWIIAERIRSSVAEATVMSKDGPVQITVSVGASVKRDAEAIDAAIRRADTCLYHAKETGRNRTVVDWVPESERDDDGVYMMASSVI